MSKFYMILLSCLLFAPAAHAATMNAADIKKNWKQRLPTRPRSLLTAPCPKRWMKSATTRKRPKPPATKSTGISQTLGEGFQDAWDAGQDAADGSPEAKAMDEAMNTLDAKCK